jgi:predicted Zn-dependent peptidase
MNKKEKPAIFKTVLDNGIRLIVKENRSIPIVSIQASFLGGVRFEKETQNGINQFMAVMVTKGTKNHSSLEIAKKVERMAGSLNGNFLLPHIPQEKSFQKIKRSEIYKEKEQDHSVLGLLATTLQHRDRYALKVLDAVLSGQGGRLFHELRDKESLAFALDFIANPNLDPGFISVYMGTHPDKLQGAIETVLRELKRVKEEGVTEKEVERAKRYLIGNFEIGLQTNGAQANQMSLDELYGLGFDLYQKYPEEIPKITREDVQQVVRKYFNLESYALAVIRPPKGK